MSSSEGRCVRSRQPTLPPPSNRTLHHPSLLPLYLAAHPHADSNNPTVHPIIPAEVFYTDPTMSCGRRIPNIVSQLRVFDCFQLNTPPPVMSACPAPPTCPDPFKSGPHPTRDLGSLIVKISTLHPPVQPSRVVLQLTMEEDQAITNLLKLHHQEPIRSDETLSAPQMDFSSVDLNPIPLFSHPEPLDSTSADKVYKPFCSTQREASLRGQLQRGRCWSETELEAAHTLLSRFNLMEEDKFWGQNHDKSAATLPDPLPYHCHEDSSINAETQQGSALITTDCTQNGFSRVRDYDELGGRDLVSVERRSAAVHLPVHEEYLASFLPQRLPSPSPDSETKSRSSVSGNFSEVRERTLSDSEGDAVHVLLSLGDMGALDVQQALS